MFTGIIEETGIVRQPAPRLTIECSQVPTDLTVGASIAVNGVCLTAIEIAHGGFSAELSPETIARSNLGDLAIGDPVNLERPLTLSARLSGHLVQGHVDGTGEFLALDPLRVRVPPELDRYLVYKGSIAIDGISLTIAEIDNCIVSVAIVPHTYQHTNLRARRPGDRVNIECDMIAKHVEKLIAARLIDAALPQSLRQSGEPDRELQVRD